MKNRAPGGRHAGRESGRAIWEGGDCKLAKPAHRKPGSSRRDPNSSVKPPSASTPPPHTQGRSWSAALTSLPEADALMAGPLWRMRKGPQRLPNRGGCLTVQPPRAGSSRCTAASASANPQHRTAARPRNPPLICRPVRLRELRREPSVSLYVAPLNASCNASGLEPDSSPAHWAAGLSLNGGGK